eukprot:sb/3468076/
MRWDYEYTLRHSHLVRSPHMWGSHQLICIRENLIMKNSDNQIQSDPDLVTPQVSDRINFPRYWKLLLEINRAPDLVAPRFRDRIIFPACPHTMQLVSYGTFSQTKESRPLQSLCQCHQTKIVMYHEHSSFYLYVLKLVNMSIGRRHSHLVRSPHMWGSHQSDPDLVTPQVSDRINFPRYWKLQSMGVDYNSHASSLCQQVMVLHCTEPSSSDSLNNPCVLDNYWKLTVFDPDLVATPTVQSDPELDRGPRFKLNLLSNQVTRFWGHVITLLAT